MREGIDPHVHLCQAKDMKNPFLFLMIGTSVLLQLTAWAAPKGELLETEKFKSGKISYEAQFFGPAEFCDYDHIVLKKGKKDILTLKKKCGRETKEKGRHVLGGGKWIQVLKLGPAVTDIYLYILEESSSYNFKTTLIQFQKNPSVIYSGPISGRFEDRNKDKLLDLVKAGGHGEPTGPSSAYDPYLVYVQVKKGKKLNFTLDEELSKEFSTQNNYEWHGAKYDENLQVDDHGHLAGTKGP